MRSFLILHGWGGSGPEHWQVWLSRQLQAQGENVRFPPLPDPDEPVLDRWLTALHTELGAMSGTRTVICHSLAVLLWLHHAQSVDVDPVERLLLVAPPGPSACQPQQATFFPPPLDAGALRRSAREILMVCSDADPFCPERAETYYGPSLGVAIHKLPDEAQHINVAAGYGPWSWVEQWCRRTL